MVSWCHDVTLVWQRTRWWGVTRELSAQIAASSKRARGSNRSPQRVGSARNYFLQPCSYFAGLAALF